MKPNPNISRTAAIACRLLGLQIAQARRERQMSTAALAERAGIARATLLKIEQGDPSVRIGSAFEVATLVGVQLFGTEEEVVREIDRGTDRLALLPARVHDHRTKSRERRYDF